LADVRGARGNGVCAVNDELRSVACVGCVVGVRVVDDFEGVVGAAGDVAGNVPGVAARVGEALCETCVSDVLLTPGKRVEER